MRHIDDGFIKDLLGDELGYFLTQVKANRSALTLEIRKGYINIYYRGGNLLKITQKKKGYAFFFDAKYCKHEGSQHFELLNGLRCDDIAAYKEFLPLMMQEMDLWFKEHPKEEREYQHQLLVKNPEIVDIEYQIGRRMRLDMLLYTNGKLLIVENKYGTGAIGGNAGVAEHYTDICGVLNDPALLDEMLESVCHISKAKKALGLVEAEISRTDIKSVEILFLLANYNPNSQSLAIEIEKMDGRIPASVLMLAGNQTKLDLTQAKNLFTEVE